MPTRSLTVASVKRIKPPKSGQLDYSDAGYPGLALRVSYGGAKTWVYFYRLHGKQRRLSLGRYPGMPLDGAREAWRIARLAVSKGESPAHVRPTTADSFGAVAQEWLKRDQAGNRSAREVRRVIERDVIPHWRDRLIAGITRRDVSDLIDGVVDRGAVIMARRLHSHLHRLFRWSVGKGIIGTNPMTDLPKPGAAVERDRVLTDAELALVWKAAAKTPWPFGPAFQLLVLTAARREEIGALRWNEIRGNEVHLPAERSKNAEPRIIPLTPPAVELIATLRRVGDFVFSSNGAGLSGWSKAKAAVDAVAAELNCGRPLAPWWVHDIRRTVATGLQRLGTGLQITEAVLGHTAGSRAGIIGVYQRHQFENEKRAALANWALDLSRIIGGSHEFTPPAAKLAYKRWLDAIQQAEEDQNFGPLLAYLGNPGTQLGPDEVFWLRQLLDRLQFKYKGPGKRVKVGTKSRYEVNEFGKLRVQELRQTECLSQEEAIDRVVKERPKWFGGPDDAASLLSHLKRGPRT